MKTIDTYYDYFRHQAANHVDLQHEETRGNKVFEIIEVDDAIGDFRSGAQHQGFIFRLINYTYRVSFVTHEATKTMQGGFLIAKYYNTDKSGKQAYNDAMVAAEKVVDDIIAKMIVDSENSHPLFNNSFDIDQDISIQPVNQKGDGNYCGWICIFTIDQFFDNCFDPQPSRWDDGGLTPFTP